MGANLLFMLVVGLLLFAIPTPPTDSEYSLPPNTYKEPINPHLHANLVHPRAPVRVSAPPLVNVSVTPTQLTGKGGWVNVTWSGVLYRKEIDWIGMFCVPEETSVVLRAPVEFKLAAGSSGGIPPPSGEVSFYVHNWRSSCLFGYVTGSAAYPLVLGLSSRVTFDNYNIPTGIHIAIAPHDPSAIIVHWTQLKVNTKSPPSVKWWPTSDPKAVAVSVATAVTYNTSNFCDVNYMPAARDGYFAPGYQLNATLHNLIPSAEYSYQAGDEFGGWSAIQTFFGPLKRGHTRTRIAAFGDMGNAPVDGGGQFSFDFNQRGELPAPNTTRAILEEVVSSTPPDIVLHIGDISYAVGYGAEWDQFMSQIEPVAARVPWMTGIGNHEYGFSKSFIPSQDSGGECAVPYLARFPFSTLDASVEWSKQSPWYSFDVGAVHVTVMSTEHDFTSKSDQYKWIEKDLASVNRSVTPWILFAGHRPMYVLSGWDGDGQFAEYLRNEIESLLIEYRIDLAIWGHFHAYERTCPVKNMTCADDGVVNIVMGMAGYELTTLIPPPAQWTPWLVSANQLQYGFVILDFEDDRSLHVTFRANDHSVLDDFVIKNKSYSILE